MFKRVFALCEILAAAFAIVICGTVLAVANTAYAEGAVNGASYTIPLDDGRGNFYDRNLIKLTGEKTQPLALLEPTANTYRTLFEKVAPQDRAEFYTAIQGTKPFVISLDDYDGVQTVNAVMRYRPAAIACHLIGYVNANGQGVSGLEKACDAILTGGSTAHTVTGIADAAGGMLDEARVNSIYGSGGGVMLTLDSVCQRICESVAEAYMQTGAIVVLDTKTARVLASVSMPRFDPDDLTQPAADTCFVNRAINAYNVGSVFKPLLAAAALENGIAADETYTCTGSIEVNGHTYRCAYGKGHGEVDMKTAIEQSCNCYFVNLGLQLGGNTVLKYANRTGLAQSTQIYGSMRTAKGTLPDKQTLKAKGELAMLSFGQGQLTATPVQIAAMFNVFANNGVYISPTFVEGEINEYTKTVEKSLYAPIMRRALHKNTAAVISNMLQGVVENGLGKNAATERLSAAGKTGTAQTGRYTEDGSEIMDAWFAGFYPADNPKITVAVMLDGGDAESDAAAKIFAQAVNQISFFL